MQKPGRLNGERRVGIITPFPAHTTNERAFMASESKLVTRTVSRKAYLSKAGHRNLSALLGQLTWLWNVALTGARPLGENARNRLPTTTSARS